MAKTPPPSPNERSGGDGTIRGNQPKPSKSVPPDNRPKPNGDSHKNERS